MSQMRATRINPAWVGIFLNKYLLDAYENLVVADAVLSVPALS